MRLVFSLSLFLLFTLSLFAQPKLKVMEGVKLDYGTIYTNEVLKKEITIKNIGTDTLTVSGVSSSCGCTVALISKDKIAPTMTGKISVSFNPERFTGTVTKGISFETNDPDQRNAHIDFTVNISKLVEVSEEYLTIPTAHVDSTTQTEFTVKNLTDKPVKILSIKSTSPFMSADPDKSTIQPSEIATINCRLRPKARGILKGNIILDLDNPNVARISTRFFALVKDKTP